MMRSDLKHGGSTPSNEDATGSGVPTVEVRGFIIRCSNGELAFCANTTSKAVPLLDGLDAVMDAVLDAPAREVSREVIELLDLDYS